MGASGSVKIKLGTQILELRLRAKNMLLLSDQNKDLVPQKKQTDKKMPHILEHSLKQ